MPSILTHYFFVNDCYETSKYSFLENNLDAANIGAQGVDPFYFYGNLIKKVDKKEINSFASLIHHSNPYSLFNYFIKEANKSSDKDLIYSYIYGLLNHYVLDRVTHPYVFYYSGIDTTSLVKHQDFETNIDMSLRALRQDYIHPKKTLKATFDVQILGDIYHRYSEENNLDLDYDTFEKSLNEMCLIEKVLYSSSGFKKSIFKLLFKNSSLNAMSIARRVDAKIDYLNLKKDTWILPSKGFKLNLSFLELMESAKSQFNKVSKILNAAYEGKNYEKELFDFIDDITHIGAKVDEEMKYSK